MYNFSYLRVKSVIISQKICLFCCDDSFETFRDGSEKLENGLYQYPQQRTAHGLIDGLFFLPIEILQKTSIFG